MPRPPVDRVPRSIRLPAELDAALADEAVKQGQSINRAVELAVEAWLAR